jgi:hypothetical protein
MPGLGSSLVASFAQSHEAMTIGAETARALGATLITQSEFDEVASRYQGSDGYKFWDELFRIYPSASALVELSRVTFNESVTEALVYCEYSVSPIGAEGSIVWLRRAGTDWEPVRWLQVWIS